MNILIINDQTMLREGLVYFLENLSEEYNVLQAASMEIARHIISDVDIDLAIAEINVSGTNAMALIGDLRTLDSDLPILFYSLFSERLYALPLLRAGVDGFISKQASLKELARAISIVLSGGKYISMELQSALVPNILTRHGANSESLQWLSNREQLVMSQLIQGKTTKEIAYTLKLKSNTVSTYKKRIYRKLNVTDCFELTQKVAIL
ncbi:two component transcriptional regulator, LuxR family [Dyadobacter soli]|uniref:Two component transcriptional regulator, LuxR family n=1 Tax=Dyadobacter soli TaxID=659014 RepID=A0A1G7MV96_9BACT|nr:response regulator transcription factor [Dyadobacter soli]SDF65693.1 two component transcriptional regulator, LuxR family [Dyadobacter soli]